MVANGTMDENIASLLWTVAEEKRSFVSAAGPQHAGKSIVLFAMLEHVPALTPIHAMNGDIEQIREFGSTFAGGYLEVGEISDHNPSRYIWGPEVAALFETIRSGYSLATTMHAEGASDVFSQISGHNAIGDTDAASIEYVVHIKRFGDDKSNYWRRIDSVSEIRGVADGVPVISKLFTWRERDDAFDAVEAPSLLRTSAAIMAERAESIRSEVNTVTTAGN